MALITRLSRLFEADFHAVLDRIEEPDLQLKQAVREMQFALDQDHQRLQLLLHEAAQLEQAGGMAKTAIKDFDEELDLCLAAKKEDLARDLIRRKLTLEKQLEAQQRRGASLESQQRQLASEIDEQEQQLSSMKQKLELLVSDASATTANSIDHAASIRSEEIEIALLREKERRAKS